jgi:hypothetical protein
VATFSNYDGCKTIDLNQGESQVELTVAQPWKGGVLGARDLAEWFSAYETLQKERSYTTQSYDARHSTPLPEEERQQQQQQPLTSDFVTPTNWRNPPTPPTPPRSPSGRYDLWKGKNVCYRRELFPSQRIECSGPSLLRQHLGPSRQQMVEGNDSFNHSDVSLEALLSAALDDALPLPPLSSEAAVKGVYDPISP